MARKSKNGGTAEAGSAVDAAQATFVQSLQSEMETALAALASTVPAIATVNSVRSRLTQLGVEVSPIPAELSAFFPTAAPVRRRGPGRPAGRKAAGGKVGRTPSGKRFQNDSNLVGALQTLLKGKEMGVSEAAEAVQKAGYKTTSDNFRVMVNQALSKDGNPFKRVSRGIYTATR